MKIYIGTGGVPISSSERSTISGIKQIAKLGLNAMEVEFVRGVKMSINMAREVGEVAKKFDVKLSVHAPYFVNLCSSDEKKVNDSKRRILESIERAYHMGANIVVFHPGFYGKLGEEEAYERVKLRCEELVDTMLDNGWDNVLLGLETTGKVSQFGTLDENIRIAKEVKGCVPVVDWAHIFARNAGRINFKEILDRVSVLRLQNLHTHFSGMEFSSIGLTGRGNERRHLNLVEGARPDYEPLVKEIVKRKLNITLISESPNLERDALFIKKLFEKYKTKL